MFFFVRGVWLAESLWVILVDSDFWGGSMTDSRAAGLLLGAVWV